MGDCNSEFFQLPPPCGQAFDMWQAIKDRWGPIFEAMNEMEIWRALRDQFELKVCSGRALSICSNEFFTELTTELPKCGPEFYKLCDFDRLIRICPFDPAWDAFEWKRLSQSERLEALEVKVKELEAKLPKGK